MPTTQVVPNRSVVRAATVFFRRIIRRLGGLSYFGCLDDLVVTYFLNKKIGITTGYNLSLTYTLNSFFLKGGGTVPYARSHNFGLKTTMVSEIPSLKKHSNEQCWTFRWSIISGEKNYPTYWTLGIGNYENPLRESLYIFLTNQILCVMTFSSFRKNNTISDIIRYHHLPLSLSHSISPTYCGGRIPAPVGRRATKSHYNPCVS